MDAVVSGMRNYSIFHFGTVFSVPKYMKCNIVQGCAEMSEWAESIEYGVDSRYDNNKDIFEGDADTGSGSGSEKTESLE